MRFARGAVAAAARRVGHREGALFWSDMACEIGRFGDLRVPEGSRKSR